MRPISQQCSAIKHPLDLIMGSQGNVRLLRILVDVGSPLGAQDVARLAGLTPAGARKALERLLDTGIVELVGSGGTLQYGLRERDPLLNAVEMLFNRERERYDSFVSLIREALAGFTEIRMAWINDAQVGPEQPLDLCVVADAKAVDWIGDELRSRISAVEKDYDLIVETKIYTRADAPARDPDTMLLVCEATGVDTRKGRAQSHIEKDGRSLLMAQEIAEMLRSDPSLVSRAKHHLNRLMHEEKGTAISAIREWRQLLETYSARQLRQLLVSTSSRATRLRQSSPFFAVLSEDERDRLLSAVEKSP